jgi:hypothetical protein
MTIALERPGASADQGVYSEIILEQNVIPRFPVPDLSAEYRSAHSWGYIELAGIVRYMKWEDQGTDDIDLSGDAVGWGLNLSSNIKLFKNDVVRLSVLVGEGVQNYMNDAPVDVGIKTTGDPDKPIEGVALPLTGVVAFFEHSWSDKFATAIGYSMIDIENSDGQFYDAFNKGEYALGNIIYYPVPDVMMVAELQYGNRENYQDIPESEPQDIKDAYLKTADIMKVQFSFKYNFSHKFIF